jgi:hypothetical protein
MAKTERFYCKCGKEAKIVRIVKVQGHQGGFRWRCEDGHYEEKWHTKKMEEKR